MKSRQILAAVSIAAAFGAAQAQTKWDLPTAYPATYFHTENIQQFANDVAKASGGKLSITVHANASLFKAPEIKRAVQGGQAQAGEILLVNFENEDTLEGIERERRYALQIVEKRFGYGDPRALPRLTELAAWYEATGRYAPARLLYKRALDVASHEGGGRNTATIDALLAIARTHRVQYAEDPESMIQVEETMPRYAESIGGRPVSRVQAAPPVAAVQAQNQPRVKMDPEGKVALDQAIDLLESSSDPPPALMSRALVEQGDWLMTAGNAAEGLASYAKAPSPGTGGVFPSVRRKGTTPG